MTDCPNAEMRDRLPDLLHERLDTMARALVQTHVENCADCRAELTLLREARLAFTSGVRSVDVTTIARVVVERTRPTALPSRFGQRRSWRTPLLNWRVAASLAALIAGGASLWLGRGPHPNGQPEAVVAVPSVAAITVGASTAAGRSVHRDSTTTVSSSRAELSAGGEVGDLSEGDLRALLKDLGGMDAVTPTESDPVVVRVSLPGSGGAD